MLRISALGTTVVAVGVATVPGVAVQVATWVVAPRESTTTNPYSSGVRRPPGRA